MKKLSRKNSDGNTRLGDMYDEYVPKPEKAPVYGKSGIDAGRDEAGDMSLEDWLALGAKVAVGVMVAKAVLDKAPASSDGEAALKHLDDSANKAETIPAVDPLPLAPTVNQIAEQILADDRVKSVLRMAQAYPNQAFKIPQMQNLLPQVHQQSPEEKKQIEVSYIGPAGGASTITGGKPSPTLVAGGPTRKLDKPGFLSKPVGGFGDVTQDALATGAAAVQAMQQASGESTAYLEQAAVHPDQIVENTKKMSVLGMALTLYTLSWAYKMLGR